ncbi:hypothetical protein MTO96_033531 [Rhipicephalus appendiculatus]
MTILEALGSVDNSMVYRPQLIRLGSTPTIGTKLTPVMWMEALSEVYGNEAPVMVGDFLLATKEHLTAAIENLFETFSAQTLWFHTTWWFLPGRRHLFEQCVAGDHSYHQLWKAWKRSECRVLRFPNRTHLQRSFSCLDQVAIHERGD